MIQNERFLYVQQFAAPAKLAAEQRLLVLYHQYKGWIWERAFAWPGTAVGIERIERMPSAVSTRLLTMSSTLLLAATHDVGLDVAVVNNAAWKRFLGVKGRASAAQKQSARERVYDVMPDLSPLLTQDDVDAIAIALYTNAEASRRA